MMLIKIVPADFFLRIHTKKCSRLMEYRAIKSISFNNVEINDNEKSKKQTAHPRQAMKWRAAEMKTTQNKNQAHKYIYICMCGDA